MWLLRRVNENTHVSPGPGASLSAQSFKVGAAAADITTTQSGNLRTNRRKKKSFLQLLMRANKNELC